MFLTFGNVRLINADCRLFIETLPNGAVIVSDPPYGKNMVINARSPRNAGLAWDKKFGTDFKPLIKGDEKPFDPSHLLDFRKVALFGANHMDGLPRGGKWIVWDKRRDSKPDDHSDCEMVWTNVEGADRIHRQKWRGIVREGEENVSRSRKLHQFQKPVALIDFIFEQIRIQPEETIVDPYMGSGSTGVCAIRRGNPFIGIESDTATFQVACKRLLEEQRTADAAR